MSKLSITPSTVEVANIQALPDLVVGQASSLKQTFDKTGADTNEYINDVLIPELNGNDGANKIGLSNPELSSDNVGDGITEVLQVAKDAQAGTIIDGSITDAKLSNTAGQIKPRVATLESDLNTLETNTSNFETDFEYPIATVVSREIRVTKLGTNSVTRFKLETAIVAGTVISVSLDGGATSKPLKNIDTTDVLELEAGFYEVIADATFFTLRASGGGGLNVKGTLGGYTDTTAYTTKMTKTGKGVLLLIQQIDSMSPEIWVDGVKRVRTGVPLSANIPFNSSLEIRTGNTSGFLAIFAMGSHDLKKCTPIVEKYNYATLSTGTTLTQSVTGKGMLIKASLNTFNVKIVLDGVTVYDLGGKTFELQGLNLRFNSSLQLYTDSTLQAVVQTLYLLE